mmetsp:Transcript_113858/g.284794  ORF Transcript_113858/g.284794 Transcript_113858/m.284794 type:complete len:208 (+) Transcript_113858:429-1052(+)
MAPSTRYTSHTLQRRAQRGAAANVGNVRQRRKPYATKTRKSLIGPSSCPVPNVCGHCMRTVPWQTIWSSTTSKTSVLKSFASASQAVFELWCWNSGAERGVRWLRSKCRGRAFPGAWKVSCSSAANGAGHCSVPSRQSTCSATAGGGQLPPCGRRQGPLSPPPPQGLPSRAGRPVDERLQCQHHGRPWRQNPRAVLKHVSGSCNHLR